MVSILVECRPGASSVRKNSKKYSNISALELLFWEPLGLISVVLIGSRRSRDYLLLMDWGLWIWCELLAKFVRGWILREFCGWSCYQGERRGWSRELGDGMNVRINWIPTYSNLNLPTPRPIHPLPPPHQPPVLTTHHPPPTAPSPSSPNILSYLISIHVSSIVCDVHPTSPTSH